MNRLARRSEKLAVKGWGGDESTPREKRGATTAGENEKKKKKKDDLSKRGRFGEKQQERPFTESNCLRSKISIEGGEKKGLPVIWAWEESGGKDTKACLRGKFFGVRLEKSSGGWGRKVIRSTDYKHI